MVHAAMAGRSWLKSLAFPIAAAGVFVLACDNPPPPPPQAAVASQIGPDGPGPVVCGLNAQPVIALYGSDCQPVNPSGLACVGNPDKAESIQNGQNTVSVSCTIAAAGTSFSVNAKIQVESQPEPGSAGNITIRGNFVPPDLSGCNPPGTTKGCPADPGKQRADDPNAASPLDVTFVRGDVGSFHGTNCVAYYTNARLSVNDATTGNFNPLMGVAAGRLWTTIYCTGATPQAGVQGHGPCNAVATIKLENCDPGTTSN